MTLKKTPGPLTAQQKRILDLLVDNGTPNSEIAQRVSMTEQSVKNELRALCALFKARNRTHLALLWDRSCRETTQG